MLSAGDTWVLVLAAGEGSRLHGLTRDTDGRAVPKQFCSLHGGPSLLQETLHRATAIAPPERTCVIVAAQHRHWWCNTLEMLPDDNIVVQPRNRGTGNGILLPLLKLLERDAEARLVLLPSDHYVGDEQQLARSLRAAEDQIARHPDKLLLLGFEPEHVDPELGYIIPAPDDGRATRPVARFLEKPAPAVARDVIAAGGLWNAFIIACRAQALLALIASRYPEIVMEMRGVIGMNATPAADIALSDLYERLPTLDFSRHVLEGREDSLRVLSVPPCGWSDLGTPHRVLSTLRRLAGNRRMPSCTHRPVAFVNLAARLQADGPAAFP